MEFYESRVYTSFNADELKVGSKVICANNINSLKCKVRDGDDVMEVKWILEESYERRFQLASKGAYPLAYLVAEPEEKKKKVTDIFLAGLKAKTQWHTDPNDLPPMIQDERHVIERVWISVENWGTEDGHYDYNKNCWIIRCRIVNLPIFGWIEIPELEV